MKIDKTILLVDDEAYIRRVIELKLRKAGYQVLTAKNGDEGFNLMKANQPDVLITDIKMPKMNGKVLCEKANEFKKERPFLTLIITCSISFDEKIWIKRMQDTVFMEKPFSLSRLLDCVDRYFGVRR